MSAVSFSHFVTARAGLARAQAERRAERFGREVVGHTIHDHDMDVHAQDPAVSPIALHIVYQDAKSNLTGRCLTLRTVKTEANDIRLGGFCYLRQRMRTFLASRVVETTDLATGEVWEDGIEFFSQHPLLRPLTADEAAARHPALFAVQECRDELILLAFVAAADGLFDSDERAAIVQHVLERVPDSDVTEASVAARLRGMVPDEFAFERALGRICAGSGDPRALMRSLRRVVDADGEIDPEEVAFVGEIEARLRESGRL